MPQLLGSCKPRTLNAKYMLLHSSASVFIVCLIFANNKQQRIQTWKRIDERKKQREYRRKRANKHTTKYVLQWNFALTVHFTHFNCSLSNPKEKRIIRIVTRFQVSPARESNLRTVNWCQRLVCDIARRHSVHISKFYFSKIFELTTNVHWNRRSESRTPLQCSIEIIYTYIYIKVWRTRTAYGFRLWSDGDKKYGDGYKTSENR